MYILIETTIFTLFVSACASVLTAACEITKLSSCGKNQLCDVIKKQCACLDGYKHNPASLSRDELCLDALPPSNSLDPSESSHSSIAIAFMLITFILLTSATVLAIRRYSLIHWLMQKIASRDSGVMYEDVMIGQDDPPITA